MEPRQITCSGKLSFNVSIFQLPKVNDIIGSVSNGAEKILFNDTTQTLPEIRRGKSLDNIKVEVNVLKTINGIFAATIMNPHNNQTWIFNGNKESMCVYDEQFTRTRDIDIGFTCNDMALNGSRDFIATDWTNDRIVRISRSGSITQICSTSPLIPYGICVNNKQQIVVGVGRAVVGHDKLVVYSSDGSSILQEIEHDQSGKRLFTGLIRRVRQTVSGDYVVANGSMITFLTSECKVTWAFEFGQEYFVLALYCDMYNNILVGDIDNDEIVMLNNDGQLIRTLLTEDDGICKPLSMDVDSKGRLWIGQERSVLISTYFI